MSIQPDWTVTAIAMTMVGMWPLLCNASVVVLYVSCTLVWQRGGSTVLVSCVSLRQLINLSEPQSPDLYNGAKSTCLPRIVKLK